MIPFDVNVLFDSNAVAFADAAGTPGSSDAFQEKYITPLFEEKHRQGREMEAAYLAAACDYQRGGFIIGFKAAVQLLADCMLDSSYTVGMKELFDTPLHKSILRRHNGGESNA